MTKSLMPRTGEKPPLVVGPWPLAGRDRQTSGAFANNKSNLTLPQGVPASASEGATVTAPSLLRYQWRTGFIRYPCPTCFRAGLKGKEEDRVTSAASKSFAFSLTAPG